MSKGADSADPPGFLEALGRRIADKRGRRSQSDLAKAIGVDVSTINEIENARRRARITTVVAIARELGVTVDELLGGPTPISAFRPPQPAGVGTLREMAERLEDQALLLQQLLDVLANHGIDVGALRQPP